MARSPLDILDSVVGGGVEHLNEAVHRRRLRRLGQHDAIDPPGSGGWARTAAHPPREGNTLEVFIDGEEALPRMAEEMRRATSYVHIAGWHLQPDFRLDHHDPGTALLPLLAELAERVEVRVLLWAGPPLPAFQPHRSNLRAVRERLTRATRIKCVLDSREYTMHCHHEKVVVIDDRVAFVGGMDLTTLQGDRFDRRDHPLREGIGWHDGATRLTGPVVTDVADHFRSRWQEVAVEPLPEPEPQPPTGERMVQLVRTVPERNYRFLPRGEFSIMESYVRALRGAERFVYLENQFLWSTEIANILDDKLRNPPCDDFRVLLVLPVRPNNGKDTTRGQLGGMIQSDGGHRLLATTIRSGSAGDMGNCYVHAKIGIVDDRWFTLGSGNLNEHSLFNDTEVNVVCQDPDLARDTRLRLWSEHLDMPVSDVDGDPCAVIDEHWIPVAREQLRRQESGEPATHRLLALPGVSRRSGRLTGPLRGLLVDG
jgi:phosphatidylserine/phosphatidylglycerophosphate/cardiolipin synthase-like enzyme